MIAVLRHIATLDFYKRKRKDYRNMLLCDKTLFFPCSANLFVTPLRGGGGSLVFLVCFQML